MTRLRVGVVGAGIGAQHLAAYAALPDHYDIAALCALEAAARAPLVAEHGISLSTDRFEDLLAADLDVIDLCTPSALHFEQALAVLEAGKHVVIEKPATRSLADLARLRAAAARAGRQAHPIYQYRFGAGFQKLLHLKVLGFCTRPSVATAETHWQRGPDYYAAAPWRGTWAGEAGGCLTTHAIHIHDMLCEVLGPLAAVQAQTAARVNGNETEDMAALLLAFGSGALATSSVTLGAQGNMSRLRFCFDGLTVESGQSPYAPGAAPWTFTAQDPAQLAAALAEFTPGPEGFAGQFQEIHSALLKGPASDPLDRAHRSLELLTAAYDAAESGRLCPLPLSPDTPMWTGWTPRQSRPT